MSDFASMIPHLKAGRSVTRTSWNDNRFIIVGEGWNDIEPNSLLINDSDDLDSFELEWPDVIAEDWAVIEWEN